MSRSLELKSDLVWDLVGHKDRAAVIDDYGVELSYSELNVECSELAGDIGRRCLVMCFCTNTLGSLLGYVAFLNSGIVPIMVDADLNRELLSDLKDKYKPQYYWLPDNKADDIDGWKICDLHGYTLVRSEYEEEFPLYGDLALLLTTSGSTGSPKLVRQSYANIKSNARSIAEYLELDENERPITTLPMNYTYGLSIINSHLLVGAEIVLTGHTLMQKEFWQTFKSRGATSFGGVPYTYEMLDKLRFFRMELPSLKTMTQAGGKLSVELHKKFAEYALNSGRKFVVMYGQTEATARMAYLPPDKALEKCGSMGIAIPGGKFTLADADGKAVADPDVVGELIYEGDNVTLGYAECGADLEKGDERHGVLQTGDMAKRDADGYYYIVGRKKRFLKIFGSRVNLDETERILKKHFPDLDCAVGGVDDKMYVFVAGKNGNDGIKKFLSETLGFFQSAFTVIDIDAIPRNEAGKTLYSALARYYGG